MISREDIKKLAELARIRLTEAEEKKLEKDLQKILAYVEKLKEVDVSNVPEMTHAIDIKNVFRDDDVQHSVSDNLVEQFPEEERGYLKVKGVFDR
ncbi:MAG: Asp-tRNA(Asn)/Glu-tRNA(Gln) amidotransferase subunit GatC [bacterium]|nr:Asp-tRNA(Asn)/Glu-tRNA(Gln) amidotransferase subunit GatC [bacterium]